MTTAHVSNNSFNEGKYSSKVLSMKEQQVANYRKRAIVAGENTVSRNGIGNQMKVEGKSVKDSTSAKGDSQAGLLPSGSVAASRTQLIERQE